LIHVYSSTGLSWQGDDVLPFQGVDNLERVLVELLEQRNSEQLLCLVQEMVPNVICEHRVLCFYDASRGTYVRERLWMEMKAKGDIHNHKAVCEVKDFSLTSAHVLSREEAVSAFFESNAKACDEVESEVDRLVDRWLLWFVAECSDPAPVTRLDFLVSRHGGCAPSVWTCEVGECGASLCSVECDARNCASLNWAVRQDPSGRFPLPLPAIRRNSGWKS